jgi:dihydroorotase/N-acyl-D-amino-acid deacylase
MLLGAKAFFVGALWVSFALPASAQLPRYDLVLRNARIVDGSGKSAYRADVAISVDTIAAIAPRIESGATRIIDVGGQVVAPGFIDVHTHVLMRRGIFEHPTADNYVRQGVTTVIEGPDGRSPVPIAPLLRQLSVLPKSVNIGTFIGQGSVRTAVMGQVNRSASPEELDKMRALVERGMRDGAFGLSSGLMYVPGVFTLFAEVVELAKVAGRLGGHYQSHIRNEADRVVEAVREAIAVGEQGGLPTQVTHHKTAGRVNWGRSVETLRLIDEARARGVDATMDQYPYDGGSGFLRTGLLCGVGARRRPRTCPHRPSGLTHSWAPPKNFLKNSWLQALRPWRQIQHKTASDRASLARLVIMTIDILRTVFAPAFKCQRLSASISDDMEICCACEAVEGARC